MKRSVVKLLGAFIFILGFFTSCENFNNGSIVRKQIEDAIAYNNASWFSINFDYPESSGVMRSPAGSEISKKVTDSFTIWFDPFTGYEFVSWKIIDSETKTEIQNGEYLTLGNIDQAQTTCSFTKAPSKNIKLCLVPVIAERPQVIFNSPISLSTLKDSRIQVRFDHDMDPYSIYYTEAEISELKNAGIEDEDFLPPLNSPQQNHYGYKKDGEVFFKNITIKNEKTGENLNNCFDAPVFENPRALSIPVKEKNSLNDFTQVLVTIEKGFYYTEKISTTDILKPVRMADKKTWMYQVNNKTDVLSPIILKSDKKDYFFVKRSDGTEINLQDYLEIKDDGSGIETLTFLKDNKIQLDLQVQDPEDGSGPLSYFELYATKDFDSNYKDLRVMDTKTWEFITPIYYENPLLIDYQTVTSDSGIFKGEIDLSPLNLDNGVYNLYCLFYDKSGNKIEYPSYEVIKKWDRFYFAIDNEISIQEPVITDVSGENSKFKIEWTPCIDLAKTVIRYKKQNETGWSEPETVLHGTDFNYITGLDLATTYDFEISYYDYAGNIKKYVLSKTTDVWGLVVTGESTKKLYFVGDNFVKDGLTIKLKNFQTDEEYSLNQNDWQVEFDTQNICIGKKAIIKYDNNGHISSGETPTVYYVAAKDALTENVIRVDNWIYKFGDFPQTIGVHQEDSYYSAEPVYPKENSYWYLGADGYFYEKSLENAYTSGLSYTDGSTVAQNNQNSFKYFKVEPMVWNLITTGERLNFISRTVFTGNIQYYLDNENRTISEQIIYPNNYQYSTVRAYLNGSYEENDTQQKIYKDCGFLQKAFTPTAQEMIVETVFGNTVDKIFALNTNLAKTVLQFYPETEHQITDYAKANNAAFEDGKVVSSWLSTPSSEDTSDEVTEAYVFSFDQYTKTSNVTERRNVLSALQVSALPE